MKHSLLILAALLGLSAPALAQTRPLPQGEIGANGDITFGNAMKLGKREGNKTIITPDTLQILSPGSTGDISTMSVTPDGSAAANTLAKRLHAPTFRGAVVAQDTITAPGANAFFTTFDKAVGDQYGIPTPARTGAKVNRINDRLLVGAATVNSGDFPATTRDWYEQLEANATHPMGFRTSWAQFASISTNGGIGVLGAARTSDINLPTFQLAMGGLFAAENDNTTAQQLATALYSVAVKKKGAGVGGHTGTVGFESDGVALDEDAISILPSNVDDPRGHVTAIKANSGAVFPGAKTASAAMSIGNNGASFWAGIVVAQNAVRGLTFDASNKVNGGGASAMRMSVFQQLEWFNTQSGEPSSVIKSEILTPANGQSIRFRDAGTFFGSADGSKAAMTLAFVGGAQNAYLSVIPGQTSSPTVLRALPLSGSNANLALRSSGTGKVSFGNATADFASATSAGLASSRLLIDGNGSPTAGAITKASDLGLIVQGVTGTNSDLSLLSPDASKTILYVPPGTANVVLGGAVSATTATLSGTLNAASAAVTGAASSATATISGTLNAGSATITNALNAGSATISGALSAASATITGNLSAALGTFSGGVAVTGGTPGAGKITRLNNLGLLIQGSAGTASEINVANAAGATIFYTPTGTANTIYGGTIQLPVQTVASLPTCNAAAKGTIAVVGDASGTPTYNAAVTGGGANSMPVFCNGDTWTMH